MASVKGAICAICMQNLVDESHWALHAATAEQTGLDQAVAASTPQKQNLALRIHRPQLLREGDASPLSLLSAAWHAGQEGRSPLRLPACTRTVTRHWPSPAAMS